MIIKCLWRVESMYTNASSLMSVGIVIKISLCLTIEFRFQTFQRLPFSHQARTHRLRNINVNLTQNNTIKTTVEPSGGGSVLKTFYLQLSSTPFYRVHIAALLVSMLPTMMISQRLSLRFVHFKSISSWTNRPEWERTNGYHLTMRSLR